METTPQPPPPPPPPSPSHLSRFATLKETDLWRKQRADAVTDAFNAASERFASVSAKYAVSIAEDLKNMLAPGTYPCMAGTTTAPTICADTLQFSHNKDEFKKQYVAAGGSLPLDPDNIFPDCPESLLP